MAYRGGSNLVPKPYDNSPVSGEGTSDSDDLELHSKRPKFLSRTRRSRSSSPADSSPRTPGGIDSLSWDSSSPRAPNPSKLSDSYWSSFSSPKAFTLSKSLGGRWGFRRNRIQTSPRKEKPLRPMLLDKLPADEEERLDYMTVVVGERKGKRKSYVINKHLLTHHLFQTLVKCSEDLLGPPAEVRTGVLIFCDPALFLQVVEVVGADLAAQWQ